MSESTIVSLYGVVTGERVVNAETVKNLEDALEMARSGEIISASIAFTYFDGLGGYWVGGDAYTMGGIGAAKCMTDKMSEEFRELNSEED